MKLIKLNFSKKKSLSPIISVILLVLVATVIAGFLLSFLKASTHTKLNNAHDALKQASSLDCAQAEIYVDSCLADVDTKDINLLVRNNSNITLYGFSLSADGNSPDGKVRLFGNFDNIVKPGEYVNLSTGSSDFNADKETNLSTLDVSSIKNLTLSNLACPNKSIFVDTCETNMCNNDGICETGENETYCSNDCPTGCNNNGVCDSANGENHLTCLDDCPYITCPTGYILVPSNSLYDTPDFCVAKYDMKVDQNGDGIGDSNTSCQYSTYGTWDNTASGCNYSNYNLVSTPEGYPLADINQADSIAACESIGGHLITNNEWMTIARNIEQVPSNWSSGTVGQGYIYSGHNDGNPNNALEASTNDNDGYYGTGNTSGNQRRTLTLTNGKVIWDLSGNVYQWTSDTIQRKDEPDGFNNSNDDVNNDGWNWFDYSKASGGSRYIKSNDLGSSTLKYKDLFLLTSGNYNATNGIGRIYTYSNRNDTSTSVYAFLRGGYWHNGSYAGVLVLGLGGGPSNRHHYLGLRCVQ